MGDTKAFYDKSVKRLPITTKITPSSIMYDGRYIELLDSDVTELAMAINKHVAKAFAAGYNAALEDVNNGWFDIQPKPDVLPPVSESTWQKIAEARARDLEESRIKYDRLLKAVRGVYYYDHWITSKGAFQSGPIEEQLWTELRNAAGFEPGGTSK